MALEYMNRGSLEAVVSAHGPMPEPALAAVARGVVAGLTELHAQYLVHRSVSSSFLLGSVRCVALCCALCCAACPLMTLCNAVYRSDIKPANILLNSDGAIKISDVMQHPTISACLLCLSH